MELKAVTRDKRSSPRQPVRVPLLFRVIPGREAGFRNGVTEDISRTGFRFHSNEILPKRAALIVEVPLFGHAPIRSPARAVWVREMPLEDGYEVGGIFVEPPYSARTTLQQVLPR